MINSNNYLGKIYSVPNLSNGFLFAKHFLEGMGKLSERKKLSITDVEKIKKNNYSVLNMEQLSSFEKMEKLRNRIKHEIEEMELRRQIELRKFRHSKL